MKFRLTAAALASLLIGLSLWAGPAAAGVVSLTAHRSPAQDTSSQDAPTPPTVLAPEDGTGATTTTLEAFEGSVGQSALPRPNGGTKPKYATDPGGAAQYAVLVGMIVGLLAILGLITRESRKKRRQLATNTRSEPVADTSVN